MATHAPRAGRAPRSPRPRAGGVASDTAGATGAANRSVPAGAGRDAPRPQSREPAGSRASPRHRPRTRNADSRQPRAARNLRLRRRPPSRARSRRPDARATAPAGFHRAGGAVNALAMPLAPLAAAFATGIAVAPWLTARPTWALGTAAAALTALLLVAGAPAHATVPLLVAVAALGAVRALPPAWPPDDVRRLALPATARVEGRLAAAPLRWAPERSRVVVDVERVDGTARSG